MVKSKIQKFSRLSMAVFCSIIFFAGVSCDTIHDTRIEAGDLQRIYVGSVTIIRTDMNGVVDAGFSATDIFGNLNLEGVQSDGKVLAAPTSGGGLKRLNSDGSPDFSFYGDWLTSSVSHVTLLNEENILLYSTNTIYRIKKDGFADVYFNSINNNSIQDHCCPKNIGLN